MRLVTLQCGLRKFEVLELPQTSAKSRVRFIFVFEGERERQREIRERELALCEIL